MFVINWVLKAVNIFCAVGLAAAFLAGEGGNYITGACIDVNGGMYFH